MGLVDILIVVIIGGFALLGFFFGFVHTIGNLIGTVVGIAVASRTSGAFSENFGGGGGGKVLAFLILFFLISRVIGVLFWLVDKVGGVISFIPFAGAFNRVLGAIFGLVEGLLTVGVLLYFSMLYLPEGALHAALESSHFAKYLIAAVSAMQVLFPASMRTTETA
jgi:membrane protein required for colicin V production